MDISLFILLGLIACLLFPLLRQRFDSSKREDFIKNYVFSADLHNAIMKEHPDLDREQTNKILEGLREYFQICLGYRCKNVGMPSKLVDTAWHEFILRTREYKEFCDNAFGNFLHHTPNGSKTSRKDADKALERTWKMSCMRESINPKNPAMLPLLFSIDSALGIDDTHLSLLETPNMFSGKSGQGGGHICGGSGSKSSSSDAADGCGGGCSGGCGGG